jgi:hypothetical protein
MAWVGFLMVQVQQGKVIQCCDSVGVAAWACFCTSLLTKHTDEIIYIVLKRSSQEAMGGAPWEVYTAVTGDTARDLEQPWNQVSWRPGPTRPRPSPI